ncbi:MAG TPA: hypothetical protein VGH99_07840 [Pseudonocardia sp.]
MAGDIGGPVAALRAELGDDLDVLDQLSPAESSALLDMIQQAREDQRRALDAALSDVLRYLPRLVRGPARKILFG